MAGNQICAITIPILILCVASSAALAQTTKQPMSFINLSCRATLYRTLCVQSLSVYAASINRSPHRLTHTALLVSLAKAKSAKSYVSLMTKTKGLGRGDREALKDCLENIGAAEGRIRGSIQEMGLLGRASKREFQWHLSNVQTWVSAALTSENTCIDGLGEGGVSRNVNAKITPMLENAKQVTSNALALINKFVAPEY
uniref:Pectinesterase inhibitor domain-containing protein n=1 Tax=Kalanchoe fedtschenkoi TaxID=63787 RepID=A0A7N0TC94_KALFE